METNQYEQITTLSKTYILSVFDLVAYKKSEIGCKALYIGKQKDIKKTCIINGLEFHKYHKAKNAKIWVYGDFS